MKNNQKHRLRIGFVMDPIRKILYREDTSVSIMEEAGNRGHRIYYIEPKNIFFKAGRLLALANRVRAGLKNGIHVLSEETLDLRSLDIVFNRKDPPFDLSYLYLTQILELLEPDVFVINSPRGVRKANEKLYILSFPQWIPPTIVSNNPVQIARFQREKKIDLILKPLDQKGGTGIALLPYGASDKKRTIGKMTRRGSRWIMAQKYLAQNSTHGDKRILLLNGKVIGAFQRIPKKGEFRSNLSLGGTALPARLTQREKRLIASIRPKLLKDGLYFVGLDVVAGYLIEINVTSPAGIAELIELEGRHPETSVVNFLEAQVSRRSLQR